MIKVLLNISLNWNAFDNIKAVVKWSLKRLRENKVYIDLGHASNCIIWYTFSVKNCRWKSNEINTVNSVFFCKGV